MFCSLKTVTPQPIPPGVWTPVRFEINNNTEAAQWHPVLDLTKPESALITPAGLPTGTESLLCAMAQWEVSDGGGQTSMQFARWPLDPKKLDTTATRDKANTPGRDYDTNTWCITLTNGMSLALRVMHNDPGPRMLVLAEFKIKVLG